jgi:general nucleoside transport system permease protein
MLLQDTLVGGIRSGTSILYASLGEVVSERSGVINLGAEGSMLAGALAGYAATAITGHPWMGVLAAAAAGAGLAGVHAILVIRRKANQLASGLAVMFFGLGLTAFLGRSFTGRQITGFKPVAIPGLSRIPFLGPILFDHDPLTYLVFVMAGALWFFLFKTRWGLILRATGERGEVAYAYGHSPIRVRYMAVCFGGLMAGIGGAQLSTAYTLSWAENMVKGRGFIAVALVIFATWNPLRAALGAYFFGAVIALELQLQARGFGVSSFILDMAPYVLTLVALLVWGRKQTHAIPEGLKAVFEGSG